MCAHGDSKSNVLFCSCTTVKEWFLPFTSVEWVSENALVAAVSAGRRVRASVCLQGHDCCPMLFSYKGVNQLTFVSKLDVPNNEQKTNKTSAMNKFKSLDKVASSDVDVSIKTLHQNRIT
jgi:actin related protein 2/3 complex subunit 1A/1B